MFICGCTETFWTLLRDRAHWEFELFLMVLFDGIVGTMLYPWIRKHWNPSVKGDTMTKPMTAPHFREIHS